MVLVICNYCKVTRDRSSLLMRPVSALASWRAHKGGMRMKRIRLSLLAGLLVACLCMAARMPAAGEEKLININTASVTELGELKGIGNAKAQVIVAHREKNGPFKSVDELRQVNGIGDKLMEKLRPHVTVGQAPAPAAAAAAKH